MADPVDTKIAARIKAHGHIAAFVAFFLALMIGVVPSNFLFVTAQCHRAVGVWVGDVNYYNNPENVCGPHMTVPSYCQQSSADPDVNNCVIGVANHATLCCKSWMQSCKALKALSLLAGGAAGLVVLAGLFFGSLSSKPWFMKIMTVLALISAASFLGFIVVTSVRMNGDFLSGAMAVTDNTTNYNTEATCGLHRYDDAERERPEYGGAFYCAIGGVVVSTVQASLFVAMSAKTARVAMSIQADASADGTSRVYEDDDELLTT